MNTSRISGVIDTTKTAASTVTFIGAGGAADLIVALARCGVGTFILIDFDMVTAANIARQGHHVDEIGRLKVEAVAAIVRRINPDARIICLPVNFLEMTDEEVDSQLGQTDLFIFATDRFAAQARGNEVALRLHKPAIWIGLYAAAGAGEIVWWAPHIDACFRCLLSKRYAAHAKAAETGQALDPASDGCTIFDVSLLDSIAGMLAIGLLTRGSDNRFGRLIDQLGDRNFLQVQLAPEWSLNGRNVIREQLGVAADCPAFFSWNTIVRADPDGGKLLCPDCEKFRGHLFVSHNGGFVRFPAGCLG
jgi:molybdopterin/thiamine biosynthesis adenylyltransferase